MEIKQVPAARCLCLLGLFLFLGPQTPCLNAQNAGNQVGQLPPEKLNIFVLEGKDATNFIPDRKGTTPVIEVRDENAFPVEGADVVFSLPASGPGGVYPGGGVTKSVKTDVDGQAGAPFVVSDSPGEFQIQVSVKAGNRTGAVAIHQTNSLTPAQETKKKSRWKFWAAGSHSIQSNA
jgi:hypothetical protein